MVSAVSTGGIVFGSPRIGRYEVLNHLASGGMGQVYLARSTGLGGFERQVVIKTLDLSVTEDDDAFVTMFLDEARLVGALHHQYIAPVYEVGLDDEGRYYLVMDYVHGETAEAVFRVAGERVLPLPLAFSLTVVSCVASALDYAHGLCSADGTPLDIVHRDVSLSNVMCGHDGSVKLIDFGIAKAANRATKTQVGTLKGKMGYLAPEQILRRPVDHRADIFALGIVLYELTTATRAFREASDLNTLERITKGEVKPPTQLIAGYPAELERIVMKALEVDPDKRFQDAGAMGRELEAFAARMNLALGHAPVLDVMGRLFAERRGRRRMARGSNEVKSDPAVAALPVPTTSIGEDEKTPITDTQTLDAETLTREVAHAFRSQRPTTPIVEKRPAPRDAHIPLEDRPTPFADPAAEMRASNALIPLEDRPTPFAEPLPAAPERPTPPQRPARIPTGPQLPQVARTSTGPQLPLAAPKPSAPLIPRTVTGPHQPPEGVDLHEAQTYIKPAADIPFEIAPTFLPREDPTDVSGVTNLVGGDFANPPGTWHAAPPPVADGAPVPARRRFISTQQLATDVIRKMPVPETTPRTWVLLCALFLLAVIVACIVAMI